MDKKKEGFSPYSGVTGPAHSQKGLQFSPKVTSRGLRGNFGILCDL